MNEDDQRTYYQILHVQPDAPVEVIKSSYRTMMQRMKMHPDLGGDHVTAALINEAYGILTDPDKRARYDETLTDLEAELAREDAKANAANEPAAEHTEATGSHFVDLGSKDSCVFCSRAHAGPIEGDSRCQHCGSPLARVGGSGTAGASWLRTMERIPADQPLRIWRDAAQAEPEICRLLDLSPTGLRFGGPQRVLTDQFVKVESDLFQAVARARHCHQSGDEWQTGAEFLTLLFERTRGAFVSAEV